MKIGPFGPLEIVIILVVILVLFGPKNLPKLGTAIGKAVKNLREGLGGGKKVEEAEEPAPKAADAKEEIEVEVIDKPEPGKKAEAAEEAKKKKHKANRFASHWYAKARFFIGARPFREYRKGRLARESRAEGCNTMDNNYVLTQEGKEKLEQELHFLETEKRAEIGDRIRVAREFGDISENSEYDDAKNEQAANEARIAEITRILGEATIVEAPTESGRVNIGSRVTVNMGGRERVFTIVGGAEANSAEGKISNESPVGAALLGHKQGENVEAQGPTGRVIKMSILAIER